MSKFKIGDPVRIKADAKEIVKGKSENLDWCSEMDGIEGRTARIDEVDTDEDYYIRGLDFGWYLPGKALELIREDELEMMNEPNTTEYTLENWSTRELLEELLRRDKNALDNTEETRG